MTTHTTAKFFLSGLLGLLIGIGGTSLILHERGGDERDHRMAGGSMMRGSLDMKGEMDGMMQGLSGKTGDDFDKAFLSEMIVHHEGAVDMAEAALKNAKHQEIKDLAQGIVAAQNSEIQKMRVWENAWYGQ